VIREQSCEEFLGAVGTGDAKREWAEIGLGAEMKGQERTAFALGGDEIDGKVLRQSVAMLRSFDCGDRFASKSVSSAQDDKSI
jgi:hypothetical protein